MRLLTCSIYCFFALTIVFGSCASKPNFSDTPKLTFISLSKSVMKQGLTNEDSIIVTIEFEDGDGDLGNGPKDPTINMFVTDRRTGDYYDQIKIPEIPPQGSTNGIKGKIYLKLFNTCCTFPPETSIPACSAPDDFPTNDLSLDIKVIDRAGNESNVITTSDIQLLCQ